MTTTKDEMIEQENLNYPIRNLLFLEKGKLMISFPAFGSGTYKNNLKSLGKKFTYPGTNKKMSFKPAKTHQSISAISKSFGSNGLVDFKRDILDLKWLQLGYIVKTGEGVFTNTTITNLGRLEKLLDKSKKINGIYLLDNGIAFAPYDSFKKRNMDSEEFAQGGLARALEYTSLKVATKLKRISSRRLYSNGIGVWEFIPESKPVKRVIGFVSEDEIGGSNLRVHSGLLEKNDLGYAFGVLK